MDTRIAADAAATALGRSAAESFDRVLRDPTLAVLRRAEPPPALPPHIAKALAHAAANPPPPIPAHLRAALDRPEAKVAASFKFPEPHPALDPKNALTKESL